MPFTRRHVLLGAATVAATLATSIFGAPLFAKGSPPASPAPKPKDIIETLTASADPSFMTFLEALKAADLTASLKAKGPLTVFALTDDAFKKLGDAKIAELNKPANEAELKALLNDHVAAGKLTAAAIAKLKTLKTAAGHTLEVLVAEDKSWTIAGVKPIKTDVVASNGVIHFVDAVLLPKVEDPKKGPADPKQGPK